MIETASSASRSAPTVTLPGGRPPRAPRVTPEDPDEMVLSSADFLPSGPISSGRGPSSRSRAAALDHDGGSPPADDPRIGMVLADRYRILEPIGRGGMGSVYKVQHVRIGKLLAMKLLAGEMVQNPEVARRFQREALAVSRLSSPNTVQVFDFGVSFGLTYLVMELVSGDHLGRLLQAEGPMPFARLGRIAVQICNALAEAHHKGIVHRDIKPENVMLVRPGGEGGAELVKVLDFGLAKLRGVDGIDAAASAPPAELARRRLSGFGGLPPVAEDETCRGTIVGTPSYMAPEQILGQEVDARTDVYSLGALMYRLATGAPPFRGDSHLEVLTKHLVERPVPPRDRAPELGIPPGFSRLVMRALRKDPADRFQRIEDLQAMLVEELKRHGSSSVEGLLDPERIRRIARAERDAGPDAAATRDEVDAYERRLRRQRYGSALAAFAVPVVAAAAVAGVLHHQRDARPAGVEIEPNDTAAEATPLALGQPMTGTVGRRLDAAHGDRDFYVFDLPASAPGARSSARLGLTSLASIATCAVLYRPGFADPVGRYCAGRPGRDLGIPALELEPGRYLLAVLQDLDSYGGAPAYVQESISDTYTFVVDRVTPDPSAEIEPNDHAAAATLLVPGKPCSAAIGWTRDEDVFCVPAAVTTAIRWSLRTGARETSALEATPLLGEGAGAPSRIAPGEDGPWRSAAFSAEGAAPRCLRVRLAGDPGGTSEPYVIEAEEVR